MTEEEKRKKLLEELAGFGSQTSQEPAPAASPPVPAPVQVQKPQALPPEPAPEIDPSILAGPEGNVSPVPQEGQQGGFLSTAGKVLGDIGTGIKEAPKAALRGAIEAGNQTLNAVDSAGDWLNQNVADLGTPQLFNEKGEFDPKLRPSRPQDGISKSPIPNVAQPTSVTGNLVESASQFLVGMLGAQKITGLKGLYGGFVNGAVSDAVVFDPHQQRLSNFVENNLGVKTAVTDWLASKPEDPEALGRLKNAVEGALLGAGVELVMGVFYAIRAWRAGAQGNTKLADELMREADKVTPDDIGFKVPQVPEQKLTAANEPGKVVDAPMIDVKSVGKENPIPPTAANDMTPEPKVSMAPDAAAQKVEDARPLVETTPEQRKQLITNIIDEIDQAKRGSEVLGDNTLPRASMGDVPKGDPRRWDWTAVEDLDSFVATSRAAARTMKERMSAGGSEGVVTWERSKQEAESLAASFGGNSETFLGHLHRKTQDATLMSAEVVAFSAMVKKAQSDMLDLLRSFKDGVVPPGYKSLQEVQEAGERLVALYVDVASSVQGIKSNIARSMNVMKMANTLSPDDIIKRQGDFRKLAEDLVAFQDDPSKMAQLIRRQYEPGFWDKAGSFHSSNLLSNIPDTHVINVVSNLVMTAAIPTSKTVGGAIRWARTGDTDLLLKGLYQYVGILGQLTEAGSAAWRAIKLNRPVLDPGSYKAAAAGPGQDGTYRLVNTKDSWSSSLQMGAELANRTWIIQQVPLRLLTGEDEFFKSLASRSAIYSDAMVAGYRAGLEGDALKAFVKERMIKSFDEGTGALIDAPALYDARLATHTLPLEPGFFKSIQDGIGKYPWLRIFAIPFYHTLVNLTKTSVRFTPGLNFAIRDVRNRIAQGGEARDRVLGEMGLGLTIWTSALTLAANGKITNGGPVGDQQQMKLRDTGWRPYAVKVDNADGSTTYVPLNNAEPFGLILGLAADLVQAGEYAKKRLENGEAVTELDDAAWALWWGVVRNVQDRNFFKGFGDLLGIINREGDASGMQKYAATVAGGFVPWSAGINYLNQYNDPILRDARTLGDRLRARIPFWSDDVVARRNWIGEEIEKRQRLATVRERDPLMEVFSVALEKTGKAPDPPRPFLEGPNRIGRVDLRQVELKDGRRAYDVMMDYVEQPSPGAKTLRDLMEAELQKPSFKNREDGEAQDPKSKMYVLMRIRHARVQAAKGKLMAKHPEVKEALRKAIEKDRKIKDARGQLIQQYGETDEAGDE